MRWGRRQSAPKIVDPRVSASPTEAPGWRVCEEERVRSSQRWLSRRRGGGEEQEEALVGPGWPWLATANKRASSGQAAPVQLRIAIAIAPSAYALVIVHGERDLLESGECIACMVCNGLSPCAAVSLCSRECRVVCKSPATACVAACVAASVSCGGQVWMLRHSCVR